MKSIHDFQKMKRAKEKIVVVTCYDYTSAKIVNVSDCDCVLVGDSAAMTMHGHPTTVAATTEMMAYHVAAVARGVSDKFIIADVPFLSMRKSLDAAMQTVQALMQAGAHAIKIEGARSNLPLIRHIVDSGVPVMGHLGLTPQSYYQFGGYGVQGREPEAARAMLEDALELEKNGCFSLVLELVPSDLARQISEQLQIATIGIGAGPDTDGQVLVFQDLLGMDEQVNFKFLKKFINGFDIVKTALNQYSREVKQRDFPTENHSF